METPHQFGVASAGERWKRGCGGETFGRFRPNWPSPTKSSSHLLYAPKSRYPKRTTPGNRQQSRRSPLGPDKVNLRRSGPLRHPASLPAPFHAPAAQPFEHIGLEFGRGIGELIASRDPPVARGVHEVIVFLDDLAFLVAMILAELAQPVRKRVEDLQAPGRERVPDFIDTAFDGVHRRLQVQPQLAVHFHERATVDLRAAQTARIYYARDPLPNRFDG